MRLVLLLDVMDTLVSDPFFNGFAEHLGLTFDELLAAKHPTAWLDFELGRLDEPGFISRFFADGRPLDGDALQRFLRRTWAWLPGIEPLLADLRAASVPMHALSNYPVWYRDIEEVLGCSRYLEWSFVSCVTGVRKPDPAAWLGAASALGVAPGDCVFVDDREGNCAAARALGLTALRFESASQLRRDLTALRLLPPAR